MQKNYYAVIMAGGVGTRFWPYSRKSYPKQFHDIMGVGKTMLQQCAERLESICGPDNIYVVTNKCYTSLVRQNLPYLKPDQILLEPEAKNTAPCIAYAVCKILAKNPEATFVVSPSDQFILKENEFRKTLLKALDYASKNQQFVTIGIVPTRPDTGYGYIQYQQDDQEEVKKVLRFAEKPNEQTAMQFIASGDFLWNSGMFICKGSTVQEAMNMYMNTTLQQFQSIAFYTPQEQDAVDNVYKNLHSISFDYAIMEKVNNVSVILGYFGWSDVGTWKSLYELAEKDADHNVIDGNVYAVGSEYNLVKVPKDKLVVLNGVNNLIVAEHENILLVCNKDDEQKVKQIVENIKTSLGKEYA